MTFYIAYISLLVYLISSLLSTYISDCTASTKPAGFAMPVSFLTFHYQLIFFHISHRFLNECVHIDPTIPMKSKTTLAQNKRQEYSHISKTNDNSIITAATKVNFQKILRIFFFIPSPYMNLFYKITLRNRLP